MRPIVLVAFEGLGFDTRMMRGGVATLVWNLATQYAERGHEVTVVTPAHGQSDRLTAQYGLQAHPWERHHELPLVLDPLVWKGFPTELTLPLRTRAQQLERDGVQVHLLTDDLLDLLPDDLYPANELLGKDLAAFKPLAFQVACLRYLADVMGDRPVVVQAVEPLYTYLLPTVFFGRPDRLVVSTVAMNPPVSGTVSRQQVQRLLDEFGVVVDLDEFVDPPDDPVRARLRRYLRPSHQAWEPPADGRRDEEVSYHALSIRHADLTDYVSEGQRDYASTYDGAPAEALYLTSAAAKATKAAVARQVVGGAGLPDWWLRADPGVVDRGHVLTGLGLDPDLPTFYHAARFDPNHKGQLDLSRAIDSVLAQGTRANFVLQCPLGTADDTQQVGHPLLRGLVERYPDRVHLDWRMRPESELYPLAASADFCLFPSKFELDGFLITMGEAMALGAVPIATAQQTLSHFGHHLPFDHGGTGFAVPRSFRADDDELAAGLTLAITAAVRLRHDEPQLYQEISERARRVARTFTWDQAADRRLAAISATLHGRPVDDSTERIVRYGWFELLTDAQLVPHRDQGAAVALARGDLHAWQRCRPGRSAPGAALFDAAYSRGDFAACSALLDLVSNDREQQVRQRFQLAREPTGDAVIRYRHDTATRVDLVTARRSVPDPGSGRRYLRALDRRHAPDLPGAWFFGTVSADDLADGKVVLLLTLGDGRVAWDWGALTDSGIQV